MKTLETLQKELDIIYDNIRGFKKQKGAEIFALEAEKYEPLIIQAQKVKEEITKEINAKYAHDLTLLSENGLKLQKAIEEIRISEGANVWHPPGTIVTKWERKGSSWSSNRKLEKTNETGTVLVYDGSQKLPENAKWGLPEKGDVVVFHHKKDGSLSMRCEIIASRGKVRQYLGSSLWLTDSETPENNLYTQKIKEKNQ
jgi:hypothetical protein